MESLRSAVFGAPGGEERVQVNTQHLIDKILARYSSTYVVYRELLQNADDATASRVEFLFRTYDDVSDTCDDSESNDAKPEKPAPPKPTIFQTLRNIVSSIVADDSAAQAKRPPVFIKTLIIRNNGKPFSPQDWHRIKVISRVDNTVGNDFRGPDLTTRVSLKETQTKQRLGFSALDSTLSSK